MRYDRRRQANAAIGAGPRQGGTAEAKFSRATRREIYIAPRMEAGTIVLLPSAVIDQLNESETLIRTVAIGFFKIYPGATKSRRIPEPCLQTGNPINFPNHGGLLWQEE
jgi:hypothetical protein